MEPHEIKITEDGVGVSESVESKQTQEKSEAPIKAKKRRGFLRHAINVIKYPFQCTDNWINFYAKHLTALEENHRILKKKIEAYRLVLGSFTEKNINPLSEADKMKVSHSFNEIERHEASANRVGMYILLSKTIVFGITYSLFFMYFLFGYLFFK